MKLISLYELDKHIRTTTVKSPSKETARLLTFRHHASYI